MSAQVFTLLVLCAVLLLLGGGLLFVAVVVLAFLFRGGGDADEGVASLPMAAPVVQAESQAPPPLDPAKGLNANLPVPKAEDPYVSVEQEDGKTEVFMRGSLNLDWDDEDEEGEATEIFRPDVHGGFNVE